MSLFPRHFNKTQTSGMLLFLVAYAIASLVHHVHNAELLGEYPNLPIWLTRAQVYAAWLVTTAIGLLGYFLLQSRFPRTGYIVLGLYGILGLYGLAHYAVAPFSAHTLGMNLSIGFEAVTASLLLTSLALNFFHNHKAE